MDRARLVFGRPISSIIVYKKLGKHRKKFKKKFVEIAFENCKLMDFCILVFALQMLVQLFRALGTSECLTAKLARELALNLRFKHGCICQQTPLFCNAYASFAP